MAWCPSAKVLKAALEFDYGCAGESYQPAQFSGDFNQFLLDVLPAERYCAINTR